jgi:glycosyltransferase involved in cell wall biosynthesis
MRRPVVATRVPGCVDAVDDGRTGILVPARDARALADALLVYLRDSARRAQDGARGREWVLRRFGREAIWSAIYDEYRRLLEARAGVALPPAEASD